MKCASLAGQDGYACGLRDETPRRPSERVPIGDGDSIHRTSDRSKGCFENFLSVSTRHDTVKLYDYQTRYSKTITYSCVHVPCRFAFSSYLFNGYLDSLAATQ